jgi:hypothetical protein
MDPTNGQSEPQTSCCRLSLTTRTDDGRYIVQIDGCNGSTVHVTGYTFYKNALSGIDSVLRLIEHADSCEFTRHY